MKNLLRLWYQNPADNWEYGALAIGNGYMGTLVYGGVDTEKLHINEKTVWRGGPSEYISYRYGVTNPTETEDELQKIREKLDAIRKKLDDKSEHVFGFAKDSYQAYGTDTKGEAMDWLNYLMGDLTGYDAPQDYANLYIDFNSGHVDLQYIDGLNSKADVVKLKKNQSCLEKKEIRNYVRDLDLTTGIATVQYDMDDAHYTREIFTSYPDRVMIIRLSADKAGMLHTRFHLEDVTGGNTLNAAEDDTIVMKSTLKDNGLQAESQLKVVTEGGNVQVEGCELIVSGADTITCYFVCGTDYKMELPDLRGMHPHEALCERLSRAVLKGYERIKGDHMQDHGALFSRMELGFGEEIPDIPTDELIQKYRNLVEGNGNDIPTKTEQRALEVICYQFGRYLTIAGSRSGALPTNLQGVWGEGEFEWGGDYHFNINIQMNYWPTMASNLAECHIPYNEYLNVLREAGRESAKAAFGIESKEGEENGWLVGCFSTPYMFAAMGQKNNAAGWNPVGSAWALLNAYEYYLYTGDKNYLKMQLYPSMKEVANFWCKALYWSDYQKRYVSAPSYSPENGPIANGVSYDQQFIWQHFENTIQAAQALGADADLVKEWKEKQSKLNPILIGEDGQIKEWFEETHIGRAKAGELPEEAIPLWRQSLGAERGGVQPPHRHLSHLMALYPCNMIDKEQTAYMDAAIVTLKERGLEATGWSKAHKLNLWARAGCAEEAFQIIQSAIGGGNSGFLTNLFSSHGGGVNYKERPIFQIDGNFGYTAGVNEMLLQSQTKAMRILPVLPKEWKDGFVKGIVARGNFVLDFSWKDGVLQEMKITAVNGGEWIGEYPKLAGYRVTDINGRYVNVKIINEARISFWADAGGRYCVKK